MTKAVIPDGKYFPIWGYSIKTDDDTHSFSTNLVNPQLPDDNVIDSGGHLLPRVMVTSLGELAVGGTQGRHQQVFTAELTAHGEVLPQCPATPFRVVSQRGRVMTDLRCVMGRVKRGSYG